MGTCSDPGRDLYAIKEWCYHREEICWATWTSLEVSVEGGHFRHAIWYEVNWEVA